MIVRSLSNAMGSMNIYINVETALFGTSIFLLVDMDLKCTIVSPLITGYPMAIHI
jgi:hypothetical protein